MNRKWNRTLFAAVVFLAPALALAQSGGSEKIKSGLESLITWLSGLMALVCTVGLMFAAMKFQTGDPDAKERMKNVAIGSIIGLSASGLMQLLKTYFS
jgi:TrbC/VIRB2 pilin